MRLLEILHPAAVINELASREPEAVLRELAACAKPSGVDSDRLLDGLRSRERLGSTGVGDGVALPHCRVEGLDHQVASFGRSRAGVDFGSTDGKPTHLFFALFSPRHLAGAHLKALARMSLLLRPDGHRASLLEAGTAEDVYRFIAQVDPFLGAAP